MGADHTLNVAKLKPNEVAKKVEELLGGQPEITFECTGQEVCLQAGVYVSTYFLHLLRQQIQSIFIVLTS